MNLNGVEYYYIRNAQSDIIGLFDKTGAQVVSYVYDSWGKLESTTGTLASTVGVKNPYRYKGYRYDTETGLYYLQSRYYNPEWGRFINADTKSGKLGQLLSHNVFAYCGNNPINCYDPSGRDWSLVWGLGEAIMAAMATIVEIVATPLLVITAIGIVGYLAYDYLSSDTNTVPDDSRVENNEQPVPQPVTFPQDPADMDKVLNVPNKKVKDGPKTKGRNKIKWDVNSDISITHEAHPYHTKAPIEHKEPHYHVEAPRLGFDHTRFLPGQPLPDIF